MRGGTIGLIVLVIVALIVLSQTLYTLDEGEQAIITQFGKPVGGAVKAAGLHAKAPFIQTLHRFEKRILVWDGSPDQIPTADKKYIWLDVTARWRIIDPLRFYQSVRNDCVAWWPKVKPGGWLCGHDIDHPGWPKWGVRAAVEEFSLNICEPMKVDKDLMHWRIRKPL